MPWITNGRLSNPTGGTVLADAQEVPDTSGFLAQVIITSSVAVLCVFEVRNFDNTQTVRSQAIAVPANSTKELDFGGIIELAPLERMRIVVNPALTTTLTGTVQGSILW